jgi:NAD(P)-dependent dehydrogenase (short-subunit alcohol dehydrogenase family)
MLTIADIEAKGLEATAGKVRDAGGEVELVRCDVSKSAEVKGLIEAVVKRYGRIDCAFNNAGIEGEVRHLADDTEENFDRVIAIDLKGVFLCMKYEIHQMLDQKTGGAIVNTASTAGLAGAHGMPAYSAAKHGVVGLTKTAALEYSRVGIRVNAVCPGVTDTPMVERLEAGRPKMAQRLVAVEPIGRKGRPEEIAEAALWLCSDDASFVTGCAMAVDGGLTAQ